MNNNTINVHMVFSDRISIEQGLYDKKNFKEIALLIGKDPSTVAKEIKRVIANDSYANDPVDCINVKNCKKKNTCGNRECDTFCKYCVTYDCTIDCNRYAPKHCEKLSKPPYVCNGCDKRISCHLGKIYYHAKDAQKIYEKKLVSSRQGINRTKEELAKINEIVAPLIGKNQPINHIFFHHSEELGISKKTLYNYIDAGLLNINNIDLQRRVKYKKRKKSKMERSNDYKYRRNRTYKDFEKYINENPELSIVEMDTVKGTNQSGKCLLTMLFRSCSLMLVFVLNRCTQQEVVRVFDLITDILGVELFRRTFQVIITDNGPEFKASDKLENTSDGEVRTKIFYCDPMKSNQKSRLEKNHEFIRYIIPKGRTMYGLTQEHATLMANHINSVARESLNGNTPFEVAKMFINEKVLNSLGLHSVSPDKVQLNSALIKK